MGDLFADFGQGSVLAYVCGSEDVETASRLLKNSLIDQGAYPGAGEPKEFQIPHPLDGGFLESLGKDQGHDYKTYSDIHKCLGNVTFKGVRTWSLVSNLVMTLSELAPKREHEK